jgi:SAM-dependent methyltransferase
MQSILNAPQFTTPPWYETWFDSRLYHSLYACRDTTEAAAFVDRLMEQRPLLSGSSVLDLGCGAGRHARQLAAHGYRVLGVDLSGESIRAARQYEKRGLCFRRQDMRLPFGVNAFSAVFNLFTSFGYFDNPADDLAVVENIARALEPGGWLVLDYLNARVAERSLCPSEVVTREGIVFQIARWSDPNHLFKRIECREGSSSHVFIERVRKLTREDFRFMFDLCGLNLEITYGDYQLAAFDADTSPRLVLIAQKERGGTTPGSNGGSGAGERDSTSRE